jgi:peptide deformylase
MKLLLNDVPVSTRHITPLHYSKIAVKSQAYDLNKPVAAEATQNLLYKMVATCLLDDGIGLAAPQIGVFKRLFVIRDMDEDDKPLETFGAYFNPSFKALSDNKETGLEGCLSVPGGAFEVARYTDIEATWYEPGEAGKLLQKTATLHGFRARVFLHELDHLQGISIVQRGKRA